MTKNIKRHLDTQWSNVGAKSTGLFEEAISNWLPTENRKLLAFIGLMLT